MALKSMYLENLLHLFIKLLFNYSVTENDYLYTMDFLDAIVDSLEEKLAEAKQA